VTGRHDGDGKADDQKAADKAVIKKPIFIRTFVWRQQIFGRHCWVLDPKGEYGALAAASGATPLRLGPGLGLRLNPLDVGAAAKGGPAAQ
jgi:hypothetical protein